MTTPHDGDDGRMTYERRRQGVTRGIGAGADMPMRLTAVKSEREDYAGCMRPLFSVVFF